MLNCKSNLSLAEWVNFPEYTDLDEKLATGGLDEGYPVPYVVVKAVSAKAGDLVKVRLRRQASKCRTPILLTTHIRRFTGSTGRYVFSHVVNRVAFSYSY
jgi:hypothetical protein